MRQTFVEQVERQRAGGYRMAFLEDEDGMRAVAGFRMSESLFAGRFCYVDDLVTDGRTFVRLRRRAVRLAGAEARATGCKRLELDSGVQRFAAHRFYLTKRMTISSHHFSLEL